MEFVVKCDLLKKRNKMKKLLLLSLIYLSLSGCTNLSIEHVFDEKGREVETICHQPRFLGIFGGFKNTCSISG